jgi:thiamine monophosphate synthase
MNQLMQALMERRAVKVIAGIANFDLDNVLMVVDAATRTGATAVDVAATPEIVRAVKAVTPITVFASSVVPEELARAVEAGADVVELGNYDALYEQGQFFDAEQVLQLAQETVALVQGRAQISVTLPGHLTLEAQRHLLMALEGVDMIQTEGAARQLSAEPTVATLTMAEKASLTLKNTRELARTCRLPLITASGIDASTVQAAFAAGASGVGIGRAVNQHASVGDMVAVLTQIMAQSRMAVAS